MIEDISRGLENYPIPVVSSKFGFPAFQYVITSVVHKEAKVTEALSGIEEGAFCKCPSDGDCLLKFYCDCAKSYPGGRFAYTQGGVLRDGFIKAKLREGSTSEGQECSCKEKIHVQTGVLCDFVATPTFISECSFLCSCHLTCGNRVVQRGMKYQVEIFHTDLKGWGVRARERIPKGAFVFEMTGEILTNAEQMARNEESGAVLGYSINCDADWMLETMADDDSALCLDAGRFGNVARFLNHR